jgi:hypothetical protein
MENQSTRTSTYSLDELLWMWKGGKLTPDQAIGHRTGRERGMLLPLIPAAGPVHP